MRSGCEDIITNKKYTVMTQKKRTITETLRSMSAGEIMEFSHDEASPAVLRELGRKIGKFSVLGVRGQKSTIVKRIK